MIEVIFELLYPDAKLPTRATTGAAGYDLSAYLDGRVIEFFDGAGRHGAEEVSSGSYRILPGARALIPLGFRARIAPGFEAQIRARSSVAFRNGIILPNGPGTIDSDYPGEWQIIVANIGASAFEVGHGSRIAQAVFARAEEVTWIAGGVGPSTDRHGGLGSTDRRGTRNSAE